MRLEDIFRFAVAALRGYGARTLLMLLAMAMGVSAVVVLTALGEGARLYVVGEFQSLGANLLIVLPGRTETAGIGPTSFIGETPRDLTLGDARALTASALVEGVAPLVIGSAPVSYRGREREVAVLGANRELKNIRDWDMARGRFLPDIDLEQALPVCVIGAKVDEELFGPRQAVGEWLRIGERRCRVIGVLASEGRALGMDVEDQVIVPVATAQALFDTPALFRIFVEARSRDALDETRNFVLETIKERHQGEEDVTVVTQDAILATFDRILRALTLTVGGIAGISLAVAGILIMNVMLIAVSQRTAEIGLLKALGAPRRRIIALFLTEAGLLSASGAIVGLAAGQLGAWAIRALYPILPATPPSWAITAALGVAVIIGLLFGTLPARRAAALDPVAALSRR